MSPLHFLSIFHVLVLVSFLTMGLFFARTGFLIPAWISEKSNWKGIVWGFSDALWKRRHPRRLFSGNALRILVDFVSSLRLSLVEVAWQGLLSLGFRAGS